MVQNLNICMESDMSELATIGLGLNSIQCTEYENYIRDKK